MIEVINLKKAFDDKCVLNNFNATFRIGANCLMGDSGAGKSTLARIMLGLLKPDAGEIRGLENKRINCVFQENRLIEELSAMKNLMLVCGKEKTKEAYDLLCEMGLEGSTNCAVSTLSGGMKRRVAIARAIINRADIYIFDEPFKGLDDARKSSIIEIIKRHTQNAVSIFITHDISDAHSFDSKIINLQQ
jgi:NitT/TauT family transport system ATP-binding protein